MLEGDGTKDNPYKISSAEELREFAKLVNDDETTAYAVLTDDIDLNNQPWTPIGSDSRPYRGTFDGANYTISGLYIDSNADYQGLFGYVSGSGKVQNLSVSGSGTVENCYNTGTVTGTDDYAGGFVGYNSGTVENCYNTGNISGGISGGVVGDNRGTVENCYNTSSVSGRYVGGVVGHSSGGISASASVTNCYNTGEVSGGEDVGGVVGHTSINSSVTNCYNIGEVSGPDSVNGETTVNVGGVVGYNIRSTVENCYNTGTVTGSGDRSNVGGVVGYNISGNVTGCYFLKDTAGSGIGVNEGNDSADATRVDDLDALCGEFKDDTWSIHPVLGRPVLNENKEGGDGLPDSPYEISTADQLENFRDIVNGANNQTADPDAHAKLMNNIDLSSVCSAKEGSWTPIGTNSSQQYSGTFNGNGKTISGLYIVSSTNNQGLFGCLDQGGTVKDLSVSGSVKGNSYVGGVVGDNRGSVTGCIFSGFGTVTGTGDYVGGVVGLNFGGTVENCYNTGNVSGSGIYVGGVVGQNFGGTVENCYNTGEVSGNSYVGGVVGYNVVTPPGGGTVENCYNTGNISGLNSVISYVGGVVGYNDSSSTVGNCYNTGNVSVKSSDISNVGGVVGYNDSSSTVTNCYNTGNVSVTSSDISSVSGDWYVGGVVGYNNGGSVTGCYFLQQNGVPEQGFGEGSGDATAKDDTAFHSGEVAYLLQSKQTTPVWGQNIGGEEDSLPTLVALDKANARKVYQLTFKYGYEDAPADEISYTNGSVKFPAFERTGHTLTGWQNEDGQAVTEPITVTADTTFTAQWQINYTVTVSANPTAGGTVSGSGEYSEGTQVTVTATPATGYHFVNWTENGTEVSTEATFTFNATVDRNLIAIFAKNEEPEPTPTPTPTPDPTPSGPSTGDSSGWDDIRDELENAENGDQITIDMGDETKVPAEIFESLAGKDVEISFDLGDIQWSVNGADIPTDTDFTDLDLGVNLGTSGIPVNVINTITGEVGTVQITLAHDGEFGFTMTLTAPLGKENAGYWANLYHYDESAEALNFEAAAKIDEDGSVTIPFSHASQYAIVIDTHSHAAVDVSDLFIDIAPDAWYKDAVQYAYDNGLMTGVSATEFAPEQTTTRAMIVSILARLEGVTTAEAAGFADVDDNDWYATAVNWAANVGVVNGYEDNTFQPNTAITREQLAAILMNYAGYKGEDVSNRADLANYTDQPSTWAEEAMSWAVAEGLISGVTNTELQPQGNATRAQVAAILQRFLDK